MRMYFYASILLSLASSAAYAQRYGPDDNLPLNQDMAVRLSVPQGSSIKLTFSFNAAWEQAIIIYRIDQSQFTQVSEVGTHGRSKRPWQSPTNTNSYDISYLVTGWHKKGGPSGSRPWFQSSCVQFSNSIYVQCEDSTDGDYNDAVAHVTRSSQRTQNSPEEHAGPVGRPVTGGRTSSLPPSQGCEGEGNPCQVHPQECGGRGSNWMVTGKIQCTSGNARCIAKPGIDYCNRCGGDCGGCFGQSCSQNYLCTPGQVCINARISINASPRWECRAIGQGCTKIHNLCWLKEEVGLAQLGCIEGY